MHFIIIELQLVSNASIKLSNSYISITKRSNCPQAPDFYTFRGKTQPIALSVICSWLNDTLKKGRKQPLEESDIHKVLERDSTNYLARKLERYFLYNPCFVIQYINVKV